MGLSWPYLPLTDLLFSALGDDHCQRGAHRTPCTMPVQYRCGTGLVTVSLRYSTARHRRGVSCTGPREIPLAFYNWLSMAPPRRITLTPEVGRARRVCPGEVAGWAAPGPVHEACGGVRSRVRAVTVLHRHHTRSAMSPPLITVSFTRTRTRANTHPFNIQVAAVGKSECPCDVIWGELLPSFALCFSFSARNW